MTSYEIVISFGRAFDVQFRGTHSGAPFAFSATSEITVPFADRESAEAAQREITVSVRPVHDAGGEDYRPVVAGEVLPGDYEKVIREQEARMRAVIVAPKPDLGDPRGDLARDMRDLRELEANSRREGNP